MSITKLKFYSIIFMLSLATSACFTYGKTERDALSAHIIHEIDLSLELLEKTKSTLNCSDALSEHIQNNISLRMVMLKNISPNINKLSLPEIQTLRYIVDHQDLFYPDNYQQYIDDLEVKIQHIISNNGAGKAKNSLKERYMPKN